MGWRRGLDSAASGGGMKTLSRREVLMTLNEHFGYDHQGSYGDEHGRPLYATMYAIVKIAQQAHWHKKESS